MRVVGCAILADRPTPGGPMERVSFDKLLRVADVVSLHAPLDATTAGLIGKAELAMMKSSAVVVNTARAALVDTAALLTALNRNEIAAAALDVLGVEPGGELEARLLEHGSVLATPHAGWYSEESFVALRRKWRARRSGSSTALRRVRPSTLL